MDFRSMEMTAGAAFCLGALVRAHQLHANLAFGDGSNPCVPIDEEGSQTAVGIAGIGGVRLLVT
jgi:hypothetical protein